ncbi:protein imuA [Gluconacetobacter sacchari DSM 12717]|uniref:Damage-inducible mutagenesis protein n=2 Tax=Gluconacetobacter sacchari TaxID=92759 RepID=A0A7W4NNV5_9PROT|nr:damage-inducible mutagenesis protein [Gluconacetobacter sacchari]MBB2161219.1 damage-inducible mutagenesis protein [Gluconacetobacter sacchari]GBQ24156.1 protein imuA [Gluconacetobacter sacchari DSM 12717]
MAQENHDTLRLLREQVARIERQHAAPHVSGTLPTGTPAIDTHLGGGLRRGAVHEIVGTGADRVTGVRPTRFVATILARAAGHIVWVRGAGTDLCLTGLRQLGLSPGRLILVETAPDQVGPLAEDILRERGILAMVADLRAPMTLSATRRLQLAAEKGGVTGFLIHQADGSVRRGQPPPLPASACQTRWQVGAAPCVLPFSTSSRTPLPGPAHWQVDLLRQRGGPAASWTFEISDDDATLPLRMVAPVADRSVATSPSRHLHLVRPGSACA